jgi:hypothetical protein
MGGVAVALLAPVLGERELLVRLEHRELADLVEVA